MGGRPGDCVTTARSFAATAALLVLSALTALSVAPAFDGDFTFDEQGGLADNRAVHPGAPLVDALAFRYSPDQARPLFFLSLWLDAQAHGMAPRGFRLTSLLLHLACGAIVFALLLRASPTGALAGAALFLLHPLQAESIIYIWGRSEVLSALFGLASLLALTPAAGKPGAGGPAPTPSAAPGRWLLAWLLLVLALAAKEEAVVLPLVAFLFWRFAIDRPWRESATRAALLGIPVLAFIVTRPILLGAVGRQVFARSLGDNLLAQAVVTLRMTWLTLLPAELSIDHAAGVPSAAAGFGAIALCLLAVAAAFLSARGSASAATRRIAGGVLIFAAAWLLYWIVPLPDLMSERRAYLPLFGAALAVAGLVDAVAARFQRRALLVALVAAILLAFPLHAALRHRALLWAAPERLWEEAFRQAPWRARPSINLGVIAAERGDREIARAHFERAVVAEARNPEALYNRGKWRLDAGDFAGAETDLAASVAADPNVARARINHAVALIHLGRLDEAAMELQAALAIDPRDPRALTNFAEILRARGHTEEALPLYRLALASDPAYAHAAVRLGVALENGGDPRGAALAYREYLRRGAASEADAAAVRGKIEALEATLAAPGSIR